MAKKPKNYDSSQYYGPAGKPPAKLPKEGLWEESIVKSALDKLSDALADTVANQIAVDMEKVIIHGYKKPLHKSSNFMIQSINADKMEVAATLLALPIKFCGVQDKLPPKCAGIFNPGDYIQFDEWYGLRLWP